MLALLLLLPEMTSPDIVALIVGSNVMCGTAFGNGPQIDKMFSVTSRQCAVGRYTFGHEIAHNFVSGV